MASSSVTLFVNVVEPFQVQFRAAYGRNESEQALIEPVIQDLQELCQNYLELEEMLQGSTKCGQNLTLRYKCLKLLVGVRFWLPLAARSFLGRNSQIPNL